LDGKLREQLELIRSLFLMHEIEQDAAKKGRIRDAARDLVEIVLPHAEAYVERAVADDTPP